MLLCYRSLLPTKMTEIGLKVNEKKKSVIQTKEDNCVIDVRIAVQSAKIIETPVLFSIFLTVADKSSRSRESML